jgi:protein-L-isoaspartate(D-aspartate) O-methyltransferase
VGGSADVVIAHAGFSHPHPLWIASLRRNGRLLVPLTRRSRHGTVVRITRSRSGYRAEAVRGITIFPVKRRGSSALDERLTDWWETASALAPLRFHRIDHGLPSNGKPRRLR